jgi:hypothetical protein
MEIRTAEGGGNTAQQIKGAIKMYKVIGNTYNVKDFLKDAGFKWDAEFKAWIGNEEAKAELEKGRNSVYYGRKMQNLLHKFNIQAVDI